MLYAPCRCTVISSTVDFAERLRADALLLSFDSRAIREALDTLNPARSRRWRRRFHYWCAATPSRCALSRSGCQSRADNVCAPPESEERDVFNSRIGSVPPGSIAPAPRCPVARRRASDSRQLCRCGPTRLLGRAVDARGFVSATARRCGAGGSSARRDCAAERDAADGRIREIWLAHCGGARCVELSAHGADSPASFVSAAMATQSAPLADFYEPARPHRRD